MMQLLIVADIRLYREGLAHIVRRDGRFGGVETASEAREAVALLSSLHRDIVLIDMAMAESLEAAHAIAEIAPESKIVALGVPELTEEVVRCAEAGITGYVPRDASLDDLLDTLEHTARGELRCTPKVAGGLLRRIAGLVEQREPDASPTRLTTREKEIAGLIENGLSNKEIARRLGIELATVKNHVHNVLEKLRVHRRADAAVRLRRSSWAREAEQFPRGYHPGMAAGARLED